MMDSSCSYVSGQSAHSQPRTKETRAALAQEQRRETLCRCSNCDGNFFLLGFRFRALGGVEISNKCSGLRLKF